MSPLGEILSAPENIHFPGKWIFSGAEKESFAIHCEGILRNSPMGTHPLCGKMDFPALINAPLKNVRFLVALYIVAIGLLNVAAGGGVAR